MGRALAVVWICLVACGGGHSGNTLSAIQKRGVLLWGADLQGGEPYVYEDPKDPTHIIGFEVDIAEAIARRLGVKAKFVQYNWSNLVQSLERGDFDIILNGLEYTDDRAQRLRLSAPYYTYAETLAVRAGAPYKTLADLDHKRVGTLNQTVAYDLLREHKDIETVVYEGNEEPYIDLEQKRTDAVLLDNIIADRYGCVPARPTIACVPGEVARGTYVIGMRRGDDALGKAVDDALAAMRKDGELQRILEKAHLWDARQSEPLPPHASINPLKREFDDHTFW